MAIGKLDHGGIPVAMASKAFRRANERVHLGPQRLDLSLRKAESLRDRHCGEIELALAGGRWLVGSTSQKSSPSISIFWPRSAGEKISPMMVKIRPIMMPAPKP